MSGVDSQAKTLVATPPKPSRWRRVLRISLILLGSHALAWGVGRAQGWWETRAEQEKGELTTKELGQSRDLVLRFEARRSLEQAQTALDARNFGIAKELVDQAARLLGASHPPADLSTLIDAVSKYQPAVTDNLAEQHQQLAQWLGQIDNQLPRQKLSPPANSP